MDSRVHSKDVKHAVYQKLQERGVGIEEIARIVMEMQIAYNPLLTLAACVESVHAVLNKRELQHAILIGIELDSLAERGLLSEPIQSIVSSDEGLFGCDETLALGSVFGYGSIAVTTFGYLDKRKSGIIRYEGRQPCSYVSGRSGGRHCRGGFRKAGASAAGPGRRHADFGARCGFGFHGMIWRRPHSKIRRISIGYNTSTRTKHTMCVGVSARELDLLGQIV